MTDVVLPGPSGIRIADMLKRQRPEIRILYCPGIRRKPTVRSWPAVGTLPLLPKPFSRDQLLRQVGRILRDGPQA